MTTPSDRVRQLLVELNDAVVAATSEAWAGDGWHYGMDNAPRTRPILVWTNQHRFLLVRWGQQHGGDVFGWLTREGVAGETFSQWHELPPSPPLPPPPREG